MIRLLTALLGSTLLLLGQQVAAEVRFQAQIDHIRFDAVNGIVLAVPEEIQVAEQSEILDESGALISLQDIETRQLDAGQMHWLRVALDGNGNARRVEVLGIDPVFPALASDEITVLVRDINTDTNRILPEPYPFIEIAPLTLESPGTSIFDADERRISLSELQTGTVVRVGGSFDGVVFRADRIDVLHEVIHTGFGGIVVDIRNADGQTDLVFGTDHAEWLTLDVEVQFDDDVVGNGIGAVRSILDQTDGPISVKLTDVDDRSGKFRRARFFDGTTFGKRWEDNHQLTMQALTGSSAIGEIHEEGFALLPAPTVFRVPANVKIWDQKNSDFSQVDEGTLDDLEPFMDVWINIQLAGTRVINADININQRPVHETLDLRVGWRDRSNSRIGFDSGGSIHLLPTARILDVSGNSLPGLHRFWDLQHEHQAVAVVTIDPATGRGSEARLVPFTELTDVRDDQIVIGTVVGIYRGFWTNPEEGEIGNHGLDGILLETAELLDITGSPVSEALLESGVGAQVTGALVSGSLFIQRIVLQGEATEWSFTTRIQGYKPSSNWIQFEESDPVRIDRDAEVFDHFGGLASLQFIQELFDRGDLKLRLTFGTSGEDGGRIVTRIDAFRHDATVDESADQETVTSGRIDPWSNPPLIYPQEIRDVSLSKDTEVIGIDGAVLTLEDLESGLRIQASGVSIDKADPNQFSSRKHNALTRIEILGGAATQYQGFIAEVSGSSLHFKTPEPLFVSTHTDFQEETGFRIDYFTLASRLDSESGLRMWLSGEFGVPGGGQVWWGRVMHADEANPSFLQEDQTIAFVVGADPENRSLIRAQIPEVQITSETEIRTRSGQAIPQTDIIADALVTVVTEERGGVTVAIEVIVDRIPQPFRLTAPVGYVDVGQRFMEFQTPNFLSLTPDAEIIDTDGSVLDLAGLKARLIDTHEDDRIIRVTPTPDSPTDAPIVSRIEIVGSALDESGGPDQLTMFIDEPEHRIRVFDRRIEPAHLPRARIAADVEITDLAGEPIDLHNIRSGMRVEVSGQDSDGRLAITSIRVVGGSVFVGEGTIARIDVPNRLLYPEPDPSRAIDPRAFVAGIDGAQIDLETYARIISENPDFVIVLEQNPFDGKLISLGLLNPEFGRPHGDNVELWDAEEIEIDVASRTLHFREEGPVILAEDATILGPQGNPIQIEDLTPGIRAFVRGEEIGDTVIITAITVIPEFEGADLIVQTGDFDDDGIENDVTIDLVDQAGNPIALPLKVFFDFRSPFEARSGHIMTDVPAGPHVIHVEVASRPEINDKARVFIGAHGSTLRIVETVPGDGATGVAANATVRITFNEPIKKFGDFVSVEGEILPEPLSDDDDLIFTLEEEGTVLVVSNLLLEEETSYTLNISSASSRNGSTLSDPVQVRFSTGSTIVSLGSLAGTISLDTDTRFIGTVHLFNEDGERVQEARISETGSYAFNAVFEGTYTVIAEAMTEDGLTISGVLEPRVELAPGEVRAGLDIALSTQVDSGPGDAPDNQQATVVLDLDTRTGNQALQNLRSLPDTEVHVAVYAKNVQNVVGYNVSFGYDSTAVTFTGVVEGTDAEINLLKKSGGLAVTLPPVVSENTIDFAGAILGSSSAQAVTGDGLLGIFRFKTRNDFSSPADFLVPRVLIQTSTSADTLGTLSRASVELASRRILLGLSASLDTIKADGLTSTRLLVDLKDADGNAVMDESTVRFEIVKGKADLSSAEITTGSSQAEVDLTGTIAGSVTVQVSVDGATAERIVIYLEESAPIGSGPLGQIALDLDPASGDQQSRTQGSLSSGDDIVIDIVVIDDIAGGMSGFEFVLLFDSDILSFTGFSAADVFAGAAPIVGASGDTVTVSSVLLGTVASQESGTIGQATFQLREDITQDATVSILRAQLGGPDGRLPLTLGTGGSIIQLGAGAGEATPDFDGDGTVGFTDFIAFAGVFGAEAGSPNFDSRFDLDATGDIGFGDFLLFAQAFGSSAKRAAKRSSISPTDLALLSRVENLGEGLKVVHLTLGEGQNASGYGLSIDYDPAEMTVEDLSTRFASALTSGAADPALTTTHQTGRITLADFGATEGDLVSVTVRSNSSVALDLTGIHLVDLSGHVTSLPDRSVALTDVPERIGIGQNFPNPFNPETVIPFSLPEAGITRLSVYNLVGQEIAVLVDDHVAAGHHTVRWNGRDDLGRAASTGIYFVRMTAGPEQHVRKIVLMK